jgi:hypothetical protein
MERWVDTTRVRKNREDYSSGRRTFHRRPVTALKFLIIVAFTVVLLTPIWYPEAGVVAWLLTPVPGIVVVNRPETPGTVPDGANDFTPIFTPDADEVPTVTVSVRESPNGTSTGPDFVWSV